MVGRLLVVVGLAREAKVAAGPGVVVVLSGGSRVHLEQRLADLDPGMFGAVASFGLAGALDPALAVGDVVATATIAGRPAPTAASERMAATWAERIEPVRQRSPFWGGPSRASARTGVGVVQEAPLAPCSAPPPPGSASLSPPSPQGGGVELARGSIAGSDRPLLSPKDKQALQAATGAVAVDMESHIAAAYAAAHGLPFAALRVISDRADVALPAIAGAAMRPDGSVDVLAVLRGLARDPTQIGPLLRTARDANAAFRVLGCVRGLLGPGFGLHL